MNCSTHPYNGCVFRSGPIEFPPDFAIFRPDQTEAVTMVELITSFFRYLGKKCSTYELPIVVAAATAFYNAVLEVSLGWNFLFALLSYLLADSVVVWLEKTRISRLPAAQQVTFYLTILTLIIIAVYFSQAA